MALLYETDWNLQRCLEALPVRDGQEDGIFIRRKGNELRMWRERRRANPPEVWSMENLLGAPLLDFTLSPQPFGTKIEIYSLENPTLRSFAIGGTIVLLGGIGWNLFLFVQAVLAGAWDSSIVNTLLSFLVVAFLAVILFYGAKRFQHLEEEFLVNQLAAQLEAKPFKPVETTSWLWDTRS